MCVYCDLQVSEKFMAVGYDSHVGGFISGYSILSSKDLAFI